MKNKHNTMNSASAAKTFSRMQNKILHNSQATCFLVEAIAKRSQNIPWACTIDKVKISHPSIRRVSLDKFYEIVTGDSHAFSKLCAILPVVIQDVLHKEKRTDYREYGFARYSKRENRKYFKCSIFYNI